MRLLRPVALVAILLLLIFTGLRWRHAAALKTTATGSATTAVTPLADTGKTSASPSADLAFARHEALMRLAYAQAWDGPLPPTLAAFRAWTERFRVAAPAARGALEAEGVALAKARRFAMLQLILTDPQHALAVTVPATVRQILPPAVQAELEARVAGRGDFAILAGTPEAADGSPKPERRRIAFVNGVTYTAHPYGSREAELTKEGASLHGIALDGQIALHESPVRVLEPGEIPGAVAEQHCPVTQLAVGALAGGAGVNLAELTVAEAFGKTWEFCATTDDMLQQFEHRLAAAEEGDNPRVVSPGVTPPVAADATTTHTAGAQKVLVIRVDFSDSPGSPVTASDAQATMDTVLKPFYENSSYGVTTLVSTVSSTIYRMPQTASAYAVAGNNSQLHADARAAAAANFTVADYDRVIVLFNRLTALPGSQINYAGLGSVGGSSVWINGTFGLRPVAHELGHTYGLEHANLWEVTDNNPVSPFGASLEYFDPFDTMNGGSTDTRFDFSPWAKNRLGWLPDSAVTTITTSGTYRVYRFDHKDAAGLQQPLALRIFRDGVRWYWIGLRQNFPTNASITNGAYVAWGFNSTQQSQLLGLTPPYYNGATAPTTTFAAGLAVGATFTDSATGITIETIARGGTDPAQYLDVKVTVPTAPANVVSAWGRNGVLFYDANTGQLTSPVPETYVPNNLTGVTNIAAGDLHVLALKADGTLVAWGDNTNGQITVPAGLNGNVASIVAGGNVSGVVKTDGTVQLWGEAVSSVLAPPANLTGVKQLAIGGGHSVGTYHALALKTDGTIIGWGDNTRGQITVPAAAASNVIAIAASDRLSVALKSDGTVVRWGTTFASSIPFPTGLNGVVAIASSGAAEHALALKADGTVVAWGGNNLNQSNVPSGLANVVAIATGGFHSLALKSDGSVVAWGSNTSGQTSIPFSSPRGFMIAGGSRASFLLTGSHLYLAAQPQAQNVAAGSSATFSVTATGVGPLTYQWRKDGVPIAGATSSTLTIPSATAANAGKYDVIVRDGTSSVTTTAATLAITAAAGQEVARISNLSILTSLASRTDTYRMGFVVGGTGTSGTKPLVIRAAGPSLGALGFPDTLGDPTVSVLTGQTEVAANDDWLGQPAAAAAMAAVGAFPYVSAASLDAVVVTDINGRDNTVVVGSAFGLPTSGAVISEIYDATPPSTFTASVPRLINVSVLKDIGASLTAGFVIAGPPGTTKKVLVRAIGPGLAAFNISSGFVLDPKLTLFNGQTQVATNDNWGGTAELTAAFISVGAFALPPTSNDAALTATLQPGNYTAVVTGAGGATGLVLVEVYEMP